jgi:hypothetical protein
MAPSPVEPSCYEIEILPPQRRGPSQSSFICLCCQRSRRSQLMDPDGCGICDDCLRPGLLPELPTAVHSTKFSDKVAQSRVGVARTTKR